MKLTRGLLSLAVVFSLGFISFIALPPQHVIAQESNTALQRGYRTGYSDGYMAGYRDSLDIKTKDFNQHEDYVKASRAYNKEYGPIEDYRDGYKQGFEAGYGTGFDKLTFNSEIPVGLSIRNGSFDQTAAPATAATEPPDPVASNVPAATSAPATTDTPLLPGSPEQTIAVKTSQTETIATPEGTITIPKESELILELQNELSTKTSKPGDKFTAKIVSPAELSGATIEGRVTKITKPGHLKRRSEIAMAFDRIIISENRWGNFSGTLTEVLPAKGDNIRRVDDEGTAVGKSSLKSDVITIGAATGSGAVIGAVAGGPVGAAVGTGVGAAFGVGAVVIDRGKDIKLNVNQQLRVKSAFDTQIR